VDNGFFVIVIIGYVLSLSHMIKLIFINKLLILIFLNVWHNYSQLPKT
jgi:hypothetical protein